MRRTPNFFYFDLGNVLLCFDHHRAARQMAEVAGISAEAAWNAVFNSDLEWRFEEGGLSEAEFHDEFCRATGSLPDAARLCNAAANIFSLNEPVLPIVAALKAAGHRLGILSNTNSIHWDFVSQGRYEIVSDYFATFALSFEIGAMKPDAAIYAAAAELAGESPERIFFVDDRPENVSGAVECGFDAVQFTSAGRLAADLKDRGLAFPVAT